MPHNQFLARVDDGALHPLPYPAAANERPTAVLLADVRQMGIIATCATGPTIADGLTEVGRKASQNPPRAEALGSRRQSIVFFHNPNYDAEIRCIPSCVNPPRPAKYPVTTSGEHLRRQLLRTQTAAY